MSGDIEAAYYAKRLEDLVEGRVERAQGFRSLIAGLGVIVVAFSIFFIRWMSVFVILLIIGAFLLATGIRSVHRDIQRAAAAHRTAKHAGLTVSPAALKPHHILTRPHTLVKHSVQRTIARPFLPAGMHEQERIRQLIAESSGQSMNSIYTRYRGEGGTLDASSFVQAVHSLQKEGFIAVEEHVRPVKK